MVEAITLQRVLLGEDIAKGSLCLTLLFYLPRRVLRLLQDEQNKRQCGFLYLARIVDPKQHQALLRDKASFTQKY